MEAVSLDNLAIVAAVAFAAPLVLGFAPWLRAPSVLVEILAGVVLGPSVLGWAEADTAVQVLSLIGVGFLLLLAGLEIDFDQLRGQLLRVALLGFVVSFALALAVSYGLWAAGAVRSPFLIAVILSATSLAVLLPLLKDAGLIESRFGQIVIAGASVADLATVILLSIFFSGHSTSVESRFVLFGGFAVLCLLVAVMIVAGGRFGRLSGVLLSLQDTTAQIRVRGAFLLLLCFSIIAQRFGLEAILGTFLAGAILKLSDRDHEMTHSHFHAKLAEAGFGFFIPVFFVSSGLRLDARAGRQRLDARQGAGLPAGALHRARPAGPSLPAVDRRAAHRCGGGAPVDDAQLRPDRRSDRGAARADHRSDGRRVDGRGAAVRPDQSRRGDLTAAIACSGHPERRHSSRAGGSMSHAALAL